MVNYNTIEVDAMKSDAVPPSRENKFEEIQMKKPRFSLFLVTLLISTAALGQSAAQKSFEQLKALAGSWEGSLDGQPIHVTLRVTSMGNALMHEMSRGASPEDPITLFNLDGERLLLTHYCDAGNQPRMAATTSPDGKTIVFNFVEATNLLSSQVGHMQRVTFTFIDSDHHTEKWEFAMADGKQMGGLLDLKRTK
jgi:hypothetical protein